MTRRRASLPDHLSGGMLRFRTYSVCLAVCSKPGHSQQSFQFGLQKKFLILSAHRCSSCAHSMIGGQSSSKVLTSQTETQNPLRTQRIFYTVPEPPLCSIMCTRCSGRLGKHFFGYFVLVGCFFLRGRGIELMWVRRRRRGTSFLSVLIFSTR